MVQVRSSVIGIENGSSKSHTESVLFSYNKERGLKRKNEHHVRAESCLQFASMNVWPARAQIYSVVQDSLVRHLRSTLIDDW